MIELVGLGEKADDARRQALRRPAAPPRRRPGAGRRPRAALPRRADDRLRPLGPAPGLGGDRRPARPRQDRLPHHPLHGRGAAPRRPGGDHRRRRDRRRGHARTSSATASASRRGSASGSRRRRRAELPLQAAASGADGELVADHATPVETLNELTGWALERGVELEGLEVAPAEPRGHLPRADRRRRRRGASERRSPSSLHQFRYDQKAFWRNPASVFFTVLFPVIFLLIFATIFGDDTIDVARRDQDDHLLRAGDHHPRGDLGDDAEPGDVADDRPRGRAA